MPTSSKAEDVWIPTLLPHELLHAVACAGPLQVRGFEAHTVESIVVSHAYTRIVLPGIKVLYW